MKPLIETATVKSLLETKGFEPIYVRQGLKNGKVLIKDELHCMGLEIGILDETEEFVVWDEDMPVFVSESAAAIAEFFEQAFLPEPDKLYVVWVQSERRHKYQAYAFENQLQMAGFVFDAEMDGQGVKDISCFTAEELKALILADFYPLDLIRNVSDESDIPEEEYFLNQIEPS